MSMMEQAEEAGSALIEREEQKRYEFLKGRQRGVSSNGLYSAMTGEAEKTYYEITRPITIEDVRRGRDKIDLMRGIFLEPIAVPLYFGTTGRRGKRQFGQVFNDEFPNAMTSPDATIFADEAREEPWKRGTGTLEIKAPRSFVFGELIDHGTREAIIYQLQGALAVRGHAWGSYGFLNLEHSDGPIFPIDVAPDPEVGHFMLEHQQAFWDQHVAPRKAPDNDKWALLLEKAPPAKEMQDGTLVVLDPTKYAAIVSMVRSFMQVNDVKKQAEEAKDGLAADLDAAMAEAFPGKSKFQVPGLGKITKVHNEGRIGFDKDALAAHRPIDRDAYIRRMREADVGAKFQPAGFPTWEAYVEHIADELALDLTRFEKRGAPYSFWKATPAK